ncbi:PAS domain S-box protein [Herbaspirillum sp. AP02]|uniref:PAS domain-containing sensor histidine kinase n=1 Tax=unclassified Herbaspirillum TaxID=2624150 RepID=UPI0015DB734F|nr:MULTISPECIES: PAS domain S-box protein [unclassified Herbaspirillum]MBG7619531.1 PAS domain S-box protein [Herbaspirillum sp. AP02]NZD69432.1 PAS domain S-box protein [Herbaspirillum sp. AP21]
MLQLEQLLLSEAPDAYVLMDMQGRVIYWNRCAEQIFGYAAQEVMSQHLSDFIVPPERRLEEDRVFADTISLGRAECQSIRRRKDGSLLHLSVSNKLLRDEQGHPQYVLSCKRDISQATVLRDISLIAASVHGLYDSLPDGIVVVNALDRIVLANRRAGELFDWEVAELTGCAIDVLIPQRFLAMHAQNLVTYLNHAAAPAHNPTPDLCGLKRNGSEFPVDVSLSPLVVEGETFLLIAVRDISDRKRIEEDLAEKNRALQEAMESRNRFLANTSHELRTPLNAILGFTDILLTRMGGPLTLEQEQQLQTVHDSAEHLLGLITSLLDVSRMETEDADLIPEALLCSQLIDETVAALRPAAAKKGLLLEVQPATGETVIHTNRRALAQILLNLVGNAIKFTEHGQVQVRWHQQPHDGSTITFIEVQDSGCGISEQDQQKLFRAFTQLDASASRKHDGMGQGLYLSQKLAHLMGGAISVQSQVGQGSRFTLCLKQKTAGN